MATITLHHPTGQQGYLLVIINTLRIIKDRSEQHDRGAHAQERDNPSEHPKHYGPPFGFLFISANNSRRHRVLGGSPKRKEPPNRWRSAEAQVAVRSKLGVQWGSNAQASVSRRRRHASG